jgi:predicted Zn finger-like uncharacterized protein
MNLATRCPSCDTVFRVVQDQLKVSEGWVRCGRCSSVFNAGEVLFDIDSSAPVHLAFDAAPAAQPEQRQHEPTQHEPTQRDTADDGAPDSERELTVTDWNPPQQPQAPEPESPWPDPASAESVRPEGRREPSFDDTPAASPPSRPEAARRGTRPTGAGARLGQREESLLRAPSAPADEFRHPGDSAPRQPARPVVTRPAALQPAGEASFTPSFLRTADRAARWRRPAVRGALFAGVLVLGLSLLGQLTWIWRDTLAAQLPASEPALRALCKLTGCQVQALRRIDALAVDSSGLNRLEGSQLYRLQLVVHNRASTALMMPALDLSLTDAQGKIVSRRVLQMADLGAPQPVLQAGQELPIKVLLSTGERRVDGYTVELFYP